MTNKMIQVSINNKQQTLEDGSTVLNALKILGRDDEAMLGVALNQTFVPKIQWAETQLKERDKLDILNPISGG